MRVGGDVVGDPPLEPFLAILTLHERADLVAGDHLQEVGDPRTGHHVGQTGRDGGVGRCFGPIVLLRLLGRLGTEEDRVVGVLVVAQRQEAELGEFRLATVRDRDLSRALESLVSIIASEHVSRQALDLAAVLGAADGRAPAKLCERIGQLRAEDVRRIHPRIIFMRDGLGIALRVEFDLFEVEFLDDLRVLAVGQTRQRPRHREHHEPRIVRVAEAAPLHIRLVEEDLFQVAGLRQLREALHADQLRGSRRDERAEARGRNLRHLGEQVDVFGVIRELVIADDRAIRLATRRAEFGLVDLLERLALVELDRLVEILEELTLADVEHPQLELGARLGVHHQMVQTPPRSLQLLEVGVVHDRGQLLRQRLVDRGDRPRDRLRDVLVEMDRAPERLLDERADEFVAAGLLDGPRHHVRDLVEEAALRGCRCRCRLLA